MTRMTSFLLALVLCLALAGCAQTPLPEDTGGEPASVPSSVPAAQPTLPQTGQEPAPSETLPPQTQPPETEPPVTEPPVTEMPETEPPATEESRPPETISPDPPPGETFTVDIADPDSLVAGNVMDYASMQLLYISDMGASYDTMERAFPKAKADKDNQELTYRRLTAKIPVSDDYNPRFALYVQTEEHEDGTWEVQELEAFRLITADGENNPSFVGVMDCSWQYGTEFHFFLMGDFYDNGAPTSWHYDEFWTQTILVACNELEGYAYDTPWRSVDFYETIAVYY